MITPKAPRRTAERILEASLVLFNRFGEPNVSTNAISAELNISPGNLYYHYPAKEQIVNALHARYENALAPILQAATDARDAEDAWFFLHTLFETVWQYRFVFRDLNDLLSRNRTLEARMRKSLQQQSIALEQLLGTLQQRGVLHIAPEDRPATATNMVVILTYWLSYEYVCDPRHALEAENAQFAPLRGARQVLGLLIPYAVPGAQRQHLNRLIGAYSTPMPTPQAMTG